MIIFLLISDPISLNKSTEMEHLLEKRKNRMSLLHVGVSEWRWACGKNVCKADEFCELQRDGGTCFKLETRVLCNMAFYCYRPSTCCGFSNCCPAGTTCTDNQCVEDGTVKSKDEETTNGVYAAAAAIPILIIVIVLIAFLCRRQSNAARRRRPPMRVSLAPTRIQLRKPPSERANTPGSSSKSSFIFPVIVTAPGTSLVEADYNAFHPESRPRAYSINTVGTSGNAPTRQVKTPSIEMKPTDDFCL